MTTTTKRGPFLPHTLATAITTAIALGAVSEAQAVSFNIGDIQGQFDSSLSVGASFAMDSPDKRFISNYNSVGATGTAASRTIDDGRLNFNKGDAFSKIFKGVHDLELKYGDSGVFVRGKYWYDYVAEDENLRFYDISDKGRDEAARGKGAEFLDAFVYHNYDIADRPGTVRLGKQVVSWGESTFIGNSINSINPVDVSALRRPGAEVKEALVPVNMFYLSQGLTENITAEGFYQLQWDKTVVDNCGTFFGIDGIAQGCDDRLVAAGLDLPPGVSKNVGAPSTTNNVYIPRENDHDPRNSGQYGLALRWLVPELNDTEFGAYAMNYHSRAPFLSVNKADNLASGPLGVVRSASYFIDYPDDIKLYGLSFQTSVGATSLGGEVSYRPSMPMQINTPDLLSAAVLNATSPLITSGFTTGTPGGEVNGYKRMPFTQAQVTATRFFDQVLGAQRLTLVGEVGYDHIGGVGSADGTGPRFGRSPSFGSGELPGVIGALTCQGSAAGTPLASNPQQECNDNGFYTSNSWGYRLRGKLDYPNVIAGINLSPSVAWSQDISGYGPNFEEGDKAVSLGLDAEYKNTYTASLSYTNYFGGYFNTNVDRDYASLSVGVNF